MKTNFYSLFFFLFLLVSCGGSDSSFDFLEGETESNTEKPVSISAWTPDNDPIFLLNSSEEKTFAVTISEGAGSSVRYHYKLDNTIVQSGVTPYYITTGSSVSPSGSHSLIVTVNNSISSDSHTFNLVKNTPPNIIAYSPISNPIAMNCGQSTQLFTGTVAFPDPEASYGDSFAFEWNVDGFTSPAITGITNTSAGSSMTFSPSCTLTGIHTISLVASDGHETSTQNWTVNIGNPNVANIDSYSPLNDPFILLSSAIQTFTVSASGQSPLAYVWRLDGNIVAGCTGSYCDLNATSIIAGAHTLEVTVTDAGSTSDSHTFNVIRNAPPSLSSISPTLSNLKINIANSQAFGTNITDANGHSMTVTWTLNNASSPYLVSNSTLSATSATLNPHVSLVGNNTIKLEVTDGYETVSRTWSLQYNYFPNYCNNLTAGRICTIAGTPGLGSGNPATHPHKAQVHPAYTTFDTTNSNNLIFSDYNSHVVWYYNQTASPVTMFGQTIAANTFKPILGVGGIAGTGTNGVTYSEYTLNTPRGVAYDSTTQSLFIAEYGANRILQLDNAGTVNIVAGGGGNNTAGNGNGILALASWISNPNDLELDVGNRRLYIANYSGHNIKYIDITNPTYTNWTSYTIAGRWAAGGGISAGSADGASAISTISSQVNGPWGLKLDTNDNILYFTEYGGCRLRAINLSLVSKSYFSSAITATSNNVTSLSGVYGGCNITNGAYNVARYQQPADVELKKSGATLEGFYITSLNAHRVQFINNTGSSITQGATAVPSLQVGTVVGDGTADYNGNGLVGNQIKLYNPFGLLISGSSLLISDINNFRLRSFDTSINNGLVGTVIGYNPKAWYYEAATTSTQYMKFNQPSALYYDENANKMFISDAANGRIRSMNLENGYLQTEIGRGVSDSNTDQEEPLYAYLYYPRSMITYNGFLIYSNWRGGGVGANIKCLVQAFNNNSVDELILGKSVVAGRVGIVAGNFPTGCQTWNPLWEGGSATSAGLYNPWGLVTDNTDMWVSNYAQHCIMKVDDSGNISRSIGSCGNTGNVSGLMGSTNIRLNSPGAMIIDPAYASEGNFFFVDNFTGGTAPAVSRIKYVNQSASAVSVGGISVGPGEIATIFNGESSYITALAAYDNQICYASGWSVYTIGAHNVLCKNRDDTLQATVLRVGKLTGSVPAGGLPIDEEQEGILPTSATLSWPDGLAFDSEGNLYIAERGAHVIRMVKRWW